MTVKSRSITSSRDRASGRFTEPPEFSGVISASEEWVELGARGRCESWLAPRPLACWKFRPRAGTWVFELPRMILGRDPADLAAAGSQDAEEGVLEWARATLAGGVPEGWALPRRGEVERLFDASRLTVLAGSRISHGELICEANPAPGRLALRFPAASFVPGTNPGREACLMAVLAEAQDRLRMVRFRGTERSGRMTIHAEVDLLGAPAHLLPELVAHALDALGWGVRRSLPILGLVADSSVSSTVLDQNLAEFPSAAFLEESHES